MEKTCLGCGRRLTKDHFHKWVGSFDGLKTQCKECRSETARIYRINNHERLTKNKRLEWQQLKQKLLDKYGNKCKRCGFDDMRALQIDHINGGGTQDRIKDSGFGLYKKMLADKTGKYQLLCANCNWIKRYENKEIMVKQKIYEN